MSLSTEHDLGLIEFVLTLCQMLWLQYLTMVRRKQLEKLLKTEVQLQKSLNSPAYFCLYSVCTVDKSKVEISQNFVALSEYENFRISK